MPDTIIPAGDLPIVTPGDFDYVVGTVLGDARRFLATALPPNAEQDLRMDAIEQAQIAGMIGYATKALHGC